MKKKLALTILAILQLVLGGVFSIKTVYANICVPPPAACSLDGSIFISQGGRTLQGTISGDTITVAIPELGTLQGKVNASMGSFSVYDPKSGQTLSGSIAGSSLCSASDDIQRQADLITYNACINASASKPSLSDLLPPATVNQINCLKLGTWYQYDDKTQACVDTKASELTLACQYNSNYGPNSYYDVSQDKCLCQGGYTMQYISSLDKLRCVSETVTVKARSLTGVLSTSTQAETSVVIPRENIQIATKKTSIIKIVASSSALMRAVEQVNSASADNSKSSTTVARDSINMEANSSTTSQKKHWYGWLSALTWFFGYFK
jgi:hypothetical protein